MFLKKIKIMNSVTTLITLIYHELLNFKINFSQEFCKQISETVYTNFNIFIYLIYERKIHKLNILANPVS